VTLMSARYVWTSRVALVIAIGSSKGAGGEGGGAGAGDERLNIEPEKKEANRFPPSLIKAAGVGNAGVTYPVASRQPLPTWLT
jgi:hypothetical protein